MPHLTHIAVGSRFGRLVIVGLGRNAKGRVRHLADCDCGTKEVVVDAPHALLNGIHKSCGCLQREKRAAGNPIHGQSHTPEHKAWCAIKDRCYNKSAGNFERYGGRGITVCQRWLDSFDNFLIDMENRPSKTHSIDRYPDNDGNYEPTNCRWATKKEQARNTRQNRIVLVRGKSMSLAEAVEIHGQNYGTVHSRLTRGFSIKAALEIE